MKSEDLQKRKPCPALRAQIGGILYECVRKKGHKGKHKNCNGFKWEGDARKDGVTR